MWEIRCFVEKIFERSFCREMNGYIRFVFEMPRDKEKPKKLLLVNL